MNERQATLEAVEAFLASEGMSATTFGRRAFNDAHFVQRFRDGANVTWKTLERVKRFMAVHLAEKAQGEAA